MKTFWLIVVDDLLRLVPYAVLCGYPFKDNFRFSRRKTVVITLLLTLVLSAVDGAMNVRPEKAMPNDLSLTNASYSVFLGLIAICFWWYLYAVKAVWQKKLFIFSFTLLSALIINSLCNIVMNLTRDNFSFVPANQWIITSNVIVTIPVVLLLCLFIKFFYMPVENGMSNAVSAVGLASREVKLNMGCRGKMLGITVDNSFNGVVYKKDGKYFSTKSEHRGLGLDSISDIAEKYRGGVEFRHDGNMFYSSIMLGLDKSGKY